MAEYKIQGETLTAIADALRAKTGATAKLTPEQMAGYIEAVQLQEKTVTPTEEVQEVTPDAGYYGLSKVTVGAAAGKELPKAEQATFGSDEADITYEIQGASLTAIADQVQRLAKTANDLTPAGMTATLQGIKSSLELNDAENSKFGNVATTYEYGASIAATGKVYTGGLAVNKSGGYRFTVGDAFAVYGIRTMGNTCPYNFTLWDSQGNALRTGAHNHPQFKAWHEYIFDTPVNLTVGETYTVSAYVTSGGCCYSSTGNHTMNSRLTNVENVTAEDTGMPTAVSTDGKLHGVVDIIIGAPVSGEVPTEYKIQRTSLTSIVDEVNRITGGTAQLSPAEVITALQAVPVQTS